MAPNQDKGKILKKNPQMMQEAPIPTETRISMMFNGLIFKILQRPSISTRRIWTTTEITMMIKKYLLRNKLEKGLIS